MKWFIAALAGGVIAACVAASPASAQLCPAGNITGRGAPTAKLLHEALIPRHTDEFCGQTRTFYNLFQSGPFTDFTTSAAAIQGAWCRTEAFQASDIPYSVAQLSMLRGALPPASSCAPFNTDYNPPFAPAPPFPGPNDAVANIMSFPVATVAVAMGVNLPAAACGGVSPGPIRVSAVNASRLWGGLITTWNDVQLVADQAPGSTLANCNVAVTRVVQSVAGGPTLAVKNYLAKVDPTRPLCDGTRWTDTARRTPAGSNFPTGGACSATFTATEEPGAIDAIGSIVGAIAFASVPEWRALAPATPLVSLSAGEAGVYRAPVDGNASSCASGPAPAGGSVGAAGLVSNAWAWDVVGSRADVTLISPTRYPICTYVFTLVRPGLRAAPPGTGAVSRLSPEQRQQLYSYLMWAMSPSGQVWLSGAGYAPVAFQLAQLIRSGIQISL